MDACLTARSISGGVRPLASKNWILWANGDACVCDACYGSAVGREWVRYLWVGEEYDSIANKFLTVLSSHGLCKGIRLVAFVCSAGFGIGRPWGYNKICVGSALHSLKNRQQHNVAAGNLQGRFARASVYSV